MTHGGHPEGLLLGSVRSGYPGRVEVRNMDGHSRTFRASTKRVLIYLVSLSAFGIFIARFGRGQTVAFGLFELCVLIAAAMLISKWPTLTIDDTGVCLSSRWGDRKAQWGEIRSITTGG